MHGRTLPVTALLALAAAVPAVPADAAVTVGSPLTRAASGAGGGCLAAPRCTTVALTADGAPAIASPIDGVVVRWRLRTTGATPDVRLRTVRRLADPERYTVTASSEAQRITTAGTHEFAARVPIAKDGLLAVDAAGVGGWYAAPGTGTTRQVGYAAPADYADGATQAPAGSVGNAELLLQADVEPDVDHDGYGDETQDEIADVQVTGSAPAEIGALDSLTQTYTIRNLGPDRTPAVTLLAGGGAAGVVGAGCSGEATCVLGPLAPGAAVTVTAAFITPAIFPPPAGTYRSELTATSATVDPVAANNRAQLATVRAPSSLPSVPVAPRPCANLITGTRDDDVVNGTAFGDAMSGRDGKDLVRGGDGDDCLSGGNGADLVDGQNGADTASGGMGDDRVTGGAGDDVVQGNRGNDRLGGGPGRDVLQPGDGRDQVTAGSGDDTITARDGARDAIDCGPGTDTVRADRRDRLRRCERVTRR